MVIEFHERCYQIIRQDFIRQNSRGFSLSMIRPLFKLNEIENFNPRRAMNMNMAHDNAMEHMLWQI